MNNFFKALYELGDKYADAHEADFVIYCGDINRTSGDALIQQCRHRKRRKKLVFMLATFGGDATAAYKVGRAFQEFYKDEFNVFIPTICKSAGTILAIAANELIMSEFAELGPIDVQLRDPMEVGEITSGLTPIQAFDNLLARSEDLFRQQFLRLRFDRYLTFSTKLAAEIATELTVGLLKPMLEQLDPIRLADVERSLAISCDYAERLSQSNGKSNLKDGAIVKLLVGYPSHGFMIDRKEAGNDLFKSVNPPNEALLTIAELADPFMSFILKEDKGPYFEFISKPINKKEDDNEDTKPEGTNTKGAL